MGTITWRFGGGLIAWKNDGLSYEYQQMLGDALHGEAQLVPYWINHGEAQLVPY